MTNSIKGMKRTDYCAKFDISNVGQTITVFGWVQRQRDLGNLIFIDLRDRTGIIQLSFNDQTDRAIFADAQSVRSEYVVAATGVVAERESKNKDIPTGEIEVIVNDFRIVSKAKTPPFEIERARRLVTKPPLNTDTSIFVTKNLQRTFLCVTKLQRLQENISMQTTLSRLKLL